MFYSDEETKREEEQFQQKLLEARAFMAENREQIDEILAYMSTVIRPLLHKEFQTPEEIALLLKCEEIIEAMQLKIRETRAIFSENRTRQAVFIMDAFKQSAAEGVEGAQEIYDRLRVSYIKMMESSISQN